MNESEPTPTPKRRVVQIAVDETEEIYLALCDDSTIWTLRRGEWARVIDVPGTTNEPQ